MREYARLGDIDNLGKMLRGKVADPDAANEAGWTALHLAAYEGRVEAARVRTPPPLSHVRL